MELGERILGNVLEDSTSLRSTQHNILKCQGLMVLEASIGCCRVLSGAVASVTQVLPGSDNNFKGYSIPNMKGQG